MRLFSSPARPICPASTRGYGVVSIVRNRNRTPRRLLSADNDSASGGEPKFDEQHLQQQQAFIAASLIDEMVKEIFDGLFVSTSARYLLEGSADRDPNEPDELTAILSSVVTPRLEGMPASVVPMLDAYLLALTTEQGATSDDDIVKVILLLKEHIIKQVESKMPESVRLLQRVVDAVDSETRAKIYDESQSGSSNDELLDSCSQLVDQLESDPQGDKRLLCKLVVVRHELRGRSSNQITNRFVQLGKIPEDELKRIEELVAVDESAARREAKALCMADDGFPGRLCDSIAALRAESSSEVLVGEFERLERVVLEVCEELSASMTKPAPTSANTDDGFRP